MIDRLLGKTAFSNDFGRQMRFIAGPRQSGKTVLSKSFLESEHCAPLYYNWDQRRIRDRYLEESHFFTRDLYNVQPGSGKRWVCMDEIHKYPNWKNLLKDFFDSFGETLGFIITGSARLDLFRKSGDSLAGRYFLFHLNPLTLRETTGGDFVLPPNNAEQLIQEKLNNVQYHQDTLEQLLEFGGFPEPFLNGQKAFHKKWSSDYFDRIIREDIRDLTHLRDMENLMTVLKLLPERIGSPLSINSLVRDLQTAHATMNGYINALELGYLVFRIPPHTRSIARSISKEKKIYFYDWTKAGGAGARFENYTAMELKTMLDLWNDSGLGEFALRYIRTRDGKETDFLILKEEKPWMLVECKLSRSAVEYHHKKQRMDLGGDLPFVQLVQESGVAENPENGIYILSASRFFV